MGREEEIELLKLQAKKYVTFTLCKTRFQRCNNLTWYSFKNKVNIGKITWVNLLNNMSVPQ